MQQSTRIKLQTESKHSLNIGNSALAPLNKSNQLSDVRYTPGGNCLDLQKTESKPKVLKVTFFNGGKQSHCQCLFPV